MTLISVIPSTPTPSQLITLSSLRKTCLSWFLDQKPVHRLIATSSAAAGAAEPARQPDGRPNDQGSNKTGSTAERAAEKAADVMEEAGADAMKQLHPAFTKFLNSGYMESQRQLRDRLMISEWDKTVRPWAAAKGVADFEKYVVEKGREADIHVTWDVMQRLYSCPDDLSPLEGNERARLLAQAFIIQAQVEKQIDVYKACTDTAKQLANVIESGQRTGASSLLSVLRRLLPLPGFLK